jgi:hypothetical protein
VLYSVKIQGHTIALVVSRQLLSAAPEFDRKSGDVGFVVGKMALGSFFYLVLQFPLPISSHHLLIIKKRIFR